MAISVEWWSVTKRDVTIEALRFGNLFALSTINMAVQALMANSVSPKMQVWQPECHNSACARNTSEVVTRQHVSQSHPSISSISYPSFISYSLTLYLLLP